MTQSNRHIKYKGGKPIKGRNPRAKTNFPDSTWKELVAIFTNPKKITFWIHLIIWSYILSRLFLTDLDLLFFSDYLNISKSKYVFYRNIFFLSAIICVWYSIGNIRFYKSVALFLLFPFYPVSIKTIQLLIWKVPKYLILKKYDFLFFTYIDKLISFAVNLKTILLKAVLLLLAFTILVGFEGTILWVSIIIFIILQVMHLYKRYEETFAPIRVFQISLESINLKYRFNKEDFNNQLTNVSKSREKDIDIAQMEYFLLISEFSNVFNKKIVDILGSKSYLKGFLFKAFYSFFISIIIFGGINYAIFKIDSSNFGFSGVPKYFEFAYYGFFNIFSEGVDIEPLSRLAKVSRMVGVSVGVIINLLVLAVYFTVRTDKYKENLQYLNNWSIDYSTNVEEYFFEKYGKKPADGLAMLKKTGNQIIEGIETVKKYLKIK